MTDYLDKLIAGLNSLYGLPAVGLVFGSCIVLGYVLRFIKKFPNDGIPVAVTLWGAVAMSLVADSRSSNMTLRIWVVRNVLVGMIIGLAAWIVHKTAISKLEDWIASKFNLGDTTFFKRKESDVPNPLPDNTKPKE